MDNGLVIYEQAISRMTLLLICPENSSDWGIRWYLLRFLGIILVVRLVLFKRFLENSLFNKRGIFSK